MIKPIRQEDPDLKVTEELVSRQASLGQERGYIMN